MAVRTCHNCVYSCCDPEVWLRCAWRGEPFLPRCANHPLWPGRMHDVSGVPCRNYRPKPVLPEGDNVRLIPLGDGFYAYVDAKDYDSLSQWEWHLNGAGYAARYQRNKRIYMHREIMQPPPGMVVDHIDGNKSNNCRFNLRVCTRLENQHNKRKCRNTTSHFKGVSYHKRSRKWLSAFGFEGSVVKLGYFSDELEAARVYDHAAVAYFGEFARLNFPEEWPPERRARVHAEWQKAENRKGAKRRAQSKGKKARDKKARPLAPTRGRRASKRATHDAKRATKKPTKNSRKTQNAKRTTNRAATEGRRGTGGRKKVREREGEKGKTAHKAAKAAKKPRKKARRTSRVAGRQQAR